jgi:hypothetical protein
MFRTISASARFSSAIDISSPGDVNYAIKESHQKEADVKYSWLSGNLSKALTIILLAFPLAFQPALAASGRKGATVVVTQSSGVQTGELVGVNDSALVLLTKTGDLTIEAALIDSVRIVKKASAIPVAIGFGVAGGAAGLGIAYATGVKSDTIGGGLAIGVGSIAIGALVGVIAGVLMIDSLSKDDVLVFKGRPDGEIKGLLTRLRSQARVTDYR